MSGHLGFVPFLASLIAFLAVVNIPRVHGATKADMYALYDDLFTTRGYKKQVRPIADDSNSLFVYMSFSLLSLVDVNEKDQNLITTARLQMIWSDYLLKWDESSFGNISSILVRQEDIWLPDVELANSVVKQKQLGYAELPVRLLSSGDIVWSPTAVLSTSCDIDVTYYPFDSQVCYIIFETSMSRNTEIDVNIDWTTPISMEDYNPDGQWDITDTYSENLSDEDSKTKIRYSLVLKRRKAYYIVNIILPVIFLSLTSTLVFALPADAGEKMSMGITVLLAYAVYLTIVADHLPNTSVQTSILAVYLTTLLGITAITVVVSVYILRLHYRPESMKVGRNAQKLALLLKTITCSLTKDDKHFSRNSVSPDQGFDSKNFSPYRVTSEDINMANAGGKHGHLGDDADFNHTHQDSGMDPNGRTRAVSHEDIARRLSTPAVYRTPMTWQHVAETTDWLLFLLFTTVTMSLTVIVMLVLVIGAQNSAPTLKKTA